MTKNIPIMKPVVNALLLAMGISTAYSIAPFEIRAASPTRVHVPEGGNVVVQYTVTNRAETSWLSMESIAGVRVLKSGYNSCGRTFRLATGEQCTLSLRIDSSVESRVFKPKVCKTRGDTKDPSPFMCNTSVEAVEVSVVPSVTRRLVGVGSTYNGRQTPTSNTSANAGYTWNLSILLGLPPGPNDQGYLTGVACDNTGLKCVAVGTSENQPFSVEPPALGDPLVYTSTDGGNTWTAIATQPTPPVGSQFTSLFTVACDSTATRCTTAGYYVDALDNFANVAYYSTDSGATWTQSALPPLDLAVYTFNSLNSISCDSTGLICTAVGAGDQPSTIDPFFQSVAYSIHSTNGGQTWGTSYTFLPNPDEPVGALASSIFCDADTGLKCTTVGSISGPATGIIVSGSTAAVAYTTTDGGATWSNFIQLEAPANTNNNIVFNVGCDSEARHCIAAGRADVIGLTPAVRIPLVYTSRDGGNSWSAPIQLSYPQGATTTSAGSGVSCTASAHICTTGGHATINGVGQNISYTSLDRGRSWSGAVIMPSSTGGYTLDPNGAFLGVQTLTGAK